MRLVLAVLLAGCFQPIHSGRAADAAAALAAGCADVRAEMDPDDGWLWRADACGKEYGCGYDQNGAMRCAPWPSRPVTDPQMLKGADPSGLCSVVFGYPETGDTWRVDACGQLQRCRRRVGGNFECGLP